MSLKHEQDEFAVQSEDLSAGVLTGVIAGVAVLVMVIVVIAVSVSGQRFEEARVDAISHSGYPDLRQTHTGSVEKLTHYKVLDQDAGVYRIPIDRAMKLVVDEAAVSSTESSELRLER